MDMSRRDNDVLRRSSSPSLKIFYFCLLILISQNYPALSIPTQNDAQEMSKAVKTQQEQSDAYEEVSSDINEHKNGSDGFMEDEMSVVSAESDGDGFVAAAEAPRNEVEAMDMKDVPNMFGDANLRRMGRPKALSRLLGRSLNGSLFRDKSYYGNVRPSGDLSYPLYDYSSSYPPPSQSARRYPEQYHSSQYDTPQSFYGYVGSRVPSLPRWNSRWSNVCCSECPRATIGYSLPGKYHCLSECKTSSCTPARTCANAADGAYGAFCQTRCPAALGGFGLLNPLLTNEACYGRCVTGVQQKCARSPCSEFGCRANPSDCMDVASRFCG